MYTQNPTRPGRLILAGLLVILTACSSYIDAFNPAIDRFNLAANAVNAQIDLLIADSAAFKDAAWQSQTSAALSNLKAAAEALNNLPEPGEKFARLNALLQELASNTILATEAYNAAIQTQDITLMDKGSQYLNRVNELLPQISAEVERLNQ